MLARCSSTSRRKEMISAHNMPKPCCTGCFPLLCFLPEAWKSPRNWEVLGDAPVPAVTPMTGTSPTEKAQGPIQLPAMPSNGKAWNDEAQFPPQETSQTLSLRANSPSSSRKGTGELSGVVNEWLMGEQFSATAILEGHFPPQFPS